MTAETQLYYHHPLNTGLNVKCFRDQDNYSSNNSVRPSTLLKLSEHIRSKYSLNLLKGKTVADSRTKRKIKVTPYTPTFRTTLTPTSSPNFWFPPKPSTPTLLHAAPDQVFEPPRATKQPSAPPGQKVYYVSGLELLSWVSSKVDRLEVPHNTDVKQR